MWNHKRPPNNQSSLEKKKHKPRNIILPDFKFYYKTVVIKTVWHWHKTKHTN